MPVPVKILVGRGTRNMHHLRSERMSCDFIKRMEAGEGEYLVKKRKFWRDIRRKPIISSINEEGNRSNIFRRELTLMETL